MKGSLFFYNLEMGGSKGDEPAAKEREDEVCIFPEIIFEKGDGRGHMVLYRFGRELEAVGNFFIGEVLIALHFKNEAALRT